MGPFLRSVFGPSVHEVWIELCRRTGAKFVEKGWWEKGKVVKIYKNWTVLLDIHKLKDGDGHTEFTRIRSPFKSKCDFRFKIYREDALSGIGKFFGMEDVEIGFEEFDDEFVIQGNDHYKLMQLFECPEIRSLVQKQPQIKLEVLDNEGYFSRYPKDVDKLEFLVRGVIKDIDVLIGLFILFEAVLDHLVTINAITEDDPGNWVV